MVHRTPLISAFLIMALASAGSAAPPRKAEVKVTPEVQAALDAIPKLKLPLPQQLRRYTDLRRLAASRRDKAGEAIVLARIGLTNVLMGQEEARIDCLRAEMKLDRSLGHTSIEALLNEYVGAYQDKWFMYADAANSYKASAQLFQSVGLKKAQAEALYYESFALSYQLRPRESYEVAEQAMKLAKSAGDKQLQGDLWLHEASVQDELGRFDQAERDRVAASQAAAAAKDLWLQTSCDLFEADLQSMEGRQASAEKLAAHALDAFAAQKKPTSAMRAAYLLGLFRARQGYLNAALEFVDRALELSVEVKELRSEESYLTFGGKLRLLLGQTTPAVQEELTGLLLEMEMRGQDCRPGPTLASPVYKSGDKARAIAMMKSSLNGMLRQDAELYRINVLEVKEFPKLDLDEFVLTANWLRESGRTKEAAQVQATRAKFLKDVSSGRNEALSIPLTNAERSWIRKYAAAARAYRPLALELSHLSRIKQEYRTAAQSKRLRERLAQAHELIIQIFGLLAPRGMSAKSLLGDEKL